MANKLTKREVINMMLAEESISANETYVAYLKHELELLDNKANNKKATKNQEENETYKTIILETLGKIGGGTVTEIMKANDTLSGLSNQRVSALLRQLKENDGKVDKVTENRKTIFFLVSGFLPTTKNLLDK